MGATAHLLCVSFTLQAEQGKADLEENVGLLRTEKTDLEKQVVELRARADQVERRANELRAAEEKKHAEEIQFLKKTNTQLKLNTTGALANYATEAGTAIYTCQMTMKDCN
uniref:Uncharacterized protein n=1 Tax=Timema tahoe TaxID=61484 RepID=A0A7R9FH36_9NEOP|nr:unnamed protein product [Timema tahoe]